MKATKTTWMALALAAAVLATAGCKKEPLGTAELRNGTKMELRGNFEEAENQYMAACAAGNAAAYPKLAALLVNRQGSAVFLEASTRDAAWLGRARTLVDRIAMVSTQAAAAGQPVEGLDQTLAGYRKSVAEVESRLAAERAEEEKRLAAERAAAEAAAKRRAEEERRAAEALAAKRAAEAEAAARRAEEARKRESADYCIEHNLTLTRAAFQEICRAMNYHQNTGNSLVDDEANARQHARYSGKMVRVSGEITKVDSKLIRGIKIKLNVYGESIWANFPNMPESEGKTYRVGQVLDVEGKVESAMLNQFNLGACIIR